MNNDIKHIFFDLDHTLWDFETNSGLTFQKIFKRHHVAVNFEEFITAYKPINFYYWKLYREEKITKSELRYRRLKEAFDALGMSVSDTIIEYLSEDYINYLTTFNHLFDDTIEVLKYLKQNYELHIITNGFEDAQERKLTRSGIKPYFTTITNSEMVGVKKPNPKIFNYALSKAKALASESIMIGDNIEADIEGAIKIGMSAILFNYNNESLSNTYHTISGLKDLLTIL